MDSILYLIEHFCFFIKKTDDAACCRRYESSTIQCWKWEDIEDSEIDREECYDGEYDLPCHTCRDDIRKCRADTDRSGEHFCSFFSLGRSDWRDEFSHSRDEDIEREMWECVGLPDTSRECFHERELDMIWIIYRKILIVDTYSYLATLWSDDKWSLSSCSRYDDSMVTIIREHRTKCIDIIDSLPIEWDHLVSCEYSCALCDSPWEWWERESAMRDIACLDTFIEWWQHQRSIVLIDDEVRSDRWCPDDEKSEKYDDSEDEVHRHSGDEYERASPPLFRRKCILLMRLITHRVFSLYTYESSYQEPVQRIASSFFILEKCLRMRWDTDTELFDTHLRISSC